MSTLSVTGRPNQPWSGIGVALFLISVLSLLPGCTPKIYKAVPECIVVKPPVGERYVVANPDERLVMMTSAYIGQTESIARCNSTIRLYNSANKAVSK